MEIRILGPLEIVAEGNLVEVPSGKPRLLLTASKPSLPWAGTPRCAVSWRSWQLSTRFASDCPAS